MNTDCLTEPVLNHDALKQLTARTRGNSNLFVHLMGHFRAEVPSTLVAMRQELETEAGSTEFFAEQAHKLKGMAAVLGAQRLWSAADRLLTNAHSQVLPDTEDLAFLEARYEEFLDAVECQEAG